MKQIATTHTYTDFDGLASLIAATLLYPGTVAVLPQRVSPGVRAFLAIHRELFEIYHPTDIDFEQVERLVVVDTNSWDRLDGMKPLKERTDLEILVWDHHTDSGTIQATWKCQKAMGATITLMLQRLQEDRHTLSQIQATLFLAGLYEDTGNLTFPSTQAEDVHAAAFLLEQQADLNVLSTILQPTYGKKQYETLFTMLKNAVRHKVGGYRISINALDLEGHVDNLALVVKMYREILNVDIAIGIFRDHNRGKSMVIGRSNSDIFDVGGVMRRIGGGGHRGAGAALLATLDSDAIQAQLESLIAEAPRTAIQLSDLMSFPVLSVSPDTPMKDVALMLREKGITGIPVVDEDKLVGMISRRDFKKVKKGRQLKAPVRAFMCTRVITADPGQSPMDIARLMVKHNIGRVPVVDQEHMIGIVTRSDSMRYFYDLLPE